ncbi:ribonuclease HII [Lentibacillus sediminis]|uniref:ribonuclease HII n=1 Tax=Lentibacillus sediminis TaxID=1940529 RepID=UPI000C1C0369|nr:ribonuclease HII [Lentibacillus sediminis]
MEKSTIKAIKERFHTGNINEEWLSHLRQDGRKGVQQLIRSYERQQAKAQELKNKFLHMTRYEQHGYANGKRLIAGVDEVGRGPLAGPVVAAAVILPEDINLLGLDDSKQLSEVARNKFYSLIKQQAVCYGIAVVGNEKIDQVNIYEAAKLAMHEALGQLDPRPDHVLADAVPLTGLPCSSEAIIKGDAKSISIAAASVLAKVYRDELMKEIHHSYPAFDFASNMGYGTRNHMEALKRQGASPFHRRSFAPVREVLQR